MNKKISILLLLFTTLSLYAQDVKIESLEKLTISELKDRKYSSQLLPEFNEKTRGNNFYVSYFSDNQKVYAKINTPSGEVPKKGFPVIILTHGWVGKEKSLNWNFDEVNENLEGQLINKFKKMGYVVVVPGYRGHGTINEKPADGIEYLYAYDNASHLINSFYAIDVVNLLEGIESLNQITLPNSENGINRLKINRLKINKEKINLLGFSEGGDIALKVAAIAGEGTTKNNIHAVSIRSGTFIDIDKQIQTYAPMNTTIKAFISGDGTWNGEAKGKNGAINKDFVYPFPGDWIENIDIGTDQWTWQQDYYTDESVEKVIFNEYTEAYKVFNSYVTNLENAKFQLKRDSNGKLKIEHDRNVAKYLKNLSAFYSPKDLTEPIILQFSDRDFYSMNGWNYLLEEKLEKNGTEVMAVEYTGNTHELKKSKQKWFSPKDTVEGFYTSINLDNMFFKKNKY